MIFLKVALLGGILLFFSSLLTATPLLEEIKREGYLEIREMFHENSAFDSLYAYFDECVAFLQNHPHWAQKLYIAKERFIRTPDRNVYSSDFFGLYDEAERKGRHQISFYYSIHFHEFIFSHYPEFFQVPQILDFFEACREIHQPYRNLCKDLASKLGLESIFFSQDGSPPILFKVIKYLPSYSAARPHYDGTAFSIFLHSTDRGALLISPYKPCLTVDDFFSPIELLHPNSLLVIPGALLTDFSIYPTPHIVAQSGKTRYATIAFAMRPNYPTQKIEFPPLPNFNH